MNRMPQYITSLVLCSLWSLAQPAEPPSSRAHYLANTGTVIEHGELKIAFDPLFSNGFDMYERVPKNMEAAFLKGIAPWDGIDAVFISHHHADHFDPALIIELLEGQDTIELYAPLQATRAIQARAASPDESFLKRVHGLAIEYGAPPMQIELGAIFIEAIGIPHAGWPNRHEHVENIVFRITLDDEVTVMHFGDADPHDVHFAKDPAHWSARRTHFAMPPYWFYYSDEGRGILSDRINAAHSIGVHVPIEMPDDPESRPDEFRGVDLFTRPGETRDISVAD